MPGRNVVAGQVFHPLAGIVVVIRTHRDVLGVDDEVHRNVDVPVAWIAQVRNDVRAVEIGSVGRVRPQRRVLGDELRVDSRELFEECRPALGELPLDPQRRQPGDVEGDGVPRRAYLGEHLLDAGEGGFAQPRLRPLAEMIEIRPGNRCVRADSVLRARLGGGFPYLHGAPVVGEHVHRSVGADGVGDSVEIRGQTRQLVRGLLGGNRALACTAGVVADHPKAILELGHDVAPQLVGIGPPMYEDDGVTVGVTALEHREADSLVDDRRTNRVAAQQAFRSIDRVRGVRCVRGRRR